VDPKGFGPGAAPGRDILLVSGVVREFPLGISRPVDVSRRELLWSLFTVGLTQGNMIGVLVPGGGAIPRWRKNTNELFKRSERWDGKFGAKSRADPGCGWIPIDDFIVVGTIFLDPSCGRGPKDVFKDSTRVRNSVLQLQPLWLGGALCVSSGLGADLPRQAKDTQLGQMYGPVGLGEASGVEGFQWIQSALGVLRPGPHFVVAPCAC